MGESRAAARRQCEVALGARTAGAAGGRAAGPECRGAVADGICADYLSGRIRGAQTYRRGTDRLLPYGHSLGEDAVEPREQQRSVVVQYVVQELNAERCARYAPTTIIGD